MWLGGGHERSVFTPLIYLLYFSKTYNEHLSNYTKTRDEYIAKYRAFPLALNLEKAQKAVEILQERVKEIGKRRKNIIEQINEIEGKMSFVIITRYFIEE